MRRHLEEKPNFTCDVFTYIKRDLLFCYHRAACILHENFLNLIFKLQINKMYAIAIA